MSKANIRRPHRFSQPEIVPTTLAGAPAGADGQMVAVSDVEGRPLWVRKGGVLVPAIDAANESLTNGVIQMRVNYSTGTSPPDGTIVHNQDEYDALGYDLKYPQDALNICPPIIKYPVVVTLEAGTHYGKPDNGLFPGYSVFLAGSRMARVQDTQYYYDYLLPYNTDYGTITFVGDGYTSLEATQAGTTTTTTVTRSAGTWTVNQHRCNHVLIKTGAAAGEIYPIASNTTTVLTIAGGFSATGAVTFEIVEPASEWVDYDNAGGADDYEGRIYTNCVYNFVNIKFGNATHGFNGMVPENGTVNLYYCKIIAKSGYSAMAHYGSPYNYSSYFFVIGSSAQTDYYNRFQEPSFTLFADSVFVCSGPNYTIRLMYSHTMDVNRCIFVCTAASGTPSIVYLYDAKLILGYTGYGGRTKLVGNNACIGLNIEKGGHSVLVTAAGLEIVDCTTAVRIRDHVNVGGIIGSNNATGWDVGDGAMARIDAPANVAVTTNAINLDGTVHPYSDVGAAGDYMDGSKGSKFIRMA